MKNPPALPVRRPSLACGILATTVAALCVTTAGHAANINSTLVSAGTANFSDTATWVGGVVPGVGDVGIVPILTGTSGTRNLTVDVSQNVQGLMLFARNGSFTGHSMNVNTVGAATLSLGTQGLKWENGNLFNINVPIILTADQTWNQTASTGSPLRINPAGSAISGPFKITRAAGSGSDSKLNIIQSQNTFSGGFAQNAHTTRIGQSSTAMNTAGPLGTGTLELTGGTLASINTTARTLRNSVELRGNIILGQVVATVSETAGGSGALTFDVGGAGTTFNIFSATSNFARTVTTDAAVTINHVIGEAGGGTFMGITKAGAGTLTLNAANTYTGVTTVNAGTLTLGANGALANNRAIVVASGAALNVSAVTGGFILGDTQIFSAGRTSGTLASDVTGNVTTAAASVLRVGNAQGVAATATYGADLNLAGGTVKFDLGATNTAGGFVNDLIATTTLNLSAPTRLNLNPTAGALADATTYTLLTYSGVLTGTEANLSILGAETPGLTRQTFTLANTGASAGSITLAVAGTNSALTWAGDGAANAWNIVGAANFTGGAAGDNKFYNFDAVTFNDSGAANPNVALTGVLVPAGITVDNSTVDYTFAGAGTITGSTGLTKTGTSKLTLATGHSYTGPVVITAGVLNVQNVLSLGLSDGTTTVADGAALELQGGIAIPFESFNISGTGVLAGGALRSVSGANAINGPVVLAAATRINADADTLSLNGGITGTGFALSIGTVGNVTIFGQGVNTGAGGSLTKDGAGTLTIAPSSNYDGATTVNAGTVSLGNTTGADNVSLFSTAAINLARAIVVRTGNTGLITIGGNAAVTSTYSGTVTLGTAGANPSKDLALTQAAGGTVIFSGVIGENTNNNTVATITVGDATRTGTVRLSNAANTYSGPTVINGGTLEVNVLANGGSNSSIGNNGTSAAAGSAATGLVINGATLRYLGAGNSTNRLVTFSELGATLESNATATPLAFTGTGAFVAAGDGNRTLALGGTSAPAILNSLASVLTDPATTGMTALIKLGANAWSLGGVNTFTGGATIDGGVLNVVADSALGATAGPLAINNGAELEAGGAVTTAARTITLGSLLPLCGGRSVETVHFLRGGAVQMLEKFTERSRSGRRVVRHEMIVIREHRPRFQRPAMLRAEVEKRALKPIAPLRRVQERPLLRAARRDEIHARTAPRLAPAPRLPPERGG